MSESALREPWPDLEPQRQASTFAIWVFLASEVLFFGGLFLGFSVYRIGYPTEFRIASRATNLVFGTINTGLLLTSSLAIALAVAGAERNRRVWTARCLWVTAVLAVAFLVVKGFEYRGDFVDGLVPGRGFALQPPATALFFGFYFIMTGIHAIHVTVGIVAIVRLAYLTGRAHLPVASPEIEVTALYWHLVDVIWIFLYPLLYLGGRVG